ncbi:MAG: carbamoyltransferase, partial [Rhodospirillaceae bacterium]
LVTEEVVLALAKGAHAHTGLPNLCLAGGVALNCVANGRLLREGPFDKIWIQPAAGDAGGALGAALAATHWHLDHPRRALAAGEKDHMAGSYLGPSFGQAEIIDQLNADGAVFEELSDAALVDQVAAELEKGAAVGWFQGRMEFGPRALGGRSILGDPRSPEMQKTLNLKVKFRESFRPFAPSVRREDVAEWFELEDDSPYMLLVAGVQSKRRVAETDGGEDLFGLDRLNQTRSEIPAVTHVDYSARIQTVDADTNPRYHALLTRFQERTGCPILVNTSFNVRGEPIVCTPSDAFRCFMGTDLDILAVGNCLLRKADQDPALAARYHQTFALD